MLAMDVILVSSGPPSTVARRRHPRELHRLRPPWRQLDEEGGRHPSELRPSTAARRRAGLVKKTMGILLASSTHPLRHAGGILVSLRASGLQLDEVDVGSVPNECHASVL